MAIMSRLIARPTIVSIQPRGVRSKQISRRIPAAIGVFAPIMTEIN